MRSFFDIDLEYDSATKQGWTHGVVEVWLSAGRRIQEERLLRISVF